MRVVQFFLTDCDNGCLIEEESSLKCIRGLWECVHVVSGYVRASCINSHERVHIGVELYLKCRG